MINEKEKKFPMYENPDPLPESPEEAGAGYYAWIETIASKRDSTQAPIIPVCSICPVISVGERTKYSVCGSYYIIPKGYTAQ